MARAKPLEGSVFSCFENEVVFNTIRSCCNHIDDNISVWDGFVLLPPRNFFWLAVQELLVFTYPERFEELNNLLLSFWLFTKLYDLMCRWC